MTVEEYYYRLYIVSQGLYHAIVTELRENDFDYCFQKLHYIVDEMQFQHMNMNIGFNFDQDDDYDYEDYYYDDYVYDDYDYYYDNE